MLLTYAYFAYRHSFFFLTLLTISYDRINYLLTFRRAIDCVTLQGYFYCINIFVYKKKVLSDGKLDLYAIYDWGCMGTGNRVRVIIFMLKREELWEGWRHLKKVEFQNLYSSTTIVVMAKAKRMSRADYVVRLEKNMQA